MNNPALSMPQVGRTPSPGILLKAKREEYGWGVADVAHALRLSEERVEAIERDDYEHLPGKTYVMGYWRSYSQLLKISIDDSIQIHRADLGAFSKDFTFDRPTSEVKGNEEGSRKRSAAVFAGLLSIVLGSIWYWQNPDVSITDWFSDSVQSFRLATTPSPEPLGQIARPEPIPDEEIGSVESAAQSDVAGSSGESGGGENAGNLVLSANQVDSVLALPVPNFSGNQNSVDINTLGYSVLITELPLSRRDLVYKAADGEELLAQVRGDKKAPVPQVKKVTQVVSNEDNTRVTQERVASSSSAQNTDSGDQRIVFNVAKESWIDVRDSTGERLIYRTVNRGEAISLKGNPPYSVFIGSAEGVAVQYQGAPVPFKAHESGLFARFEVGQ